MSVMPHKLRARLALLVIACTVCGLTRPALALRTGQHGNRPVPNRGWPLGCGIVANLPSRLGYWVGPPFGGGEFHFLYRCKDTDEFNEALKLFAAIRVPKLVRHSATSKDLAVTCRAEAHPLELIVHDGPGTSLWLRDNKDSNARDKSRLDWTFTIWKPSNWHRLYNYPKSFRSADHPNFRQPVPPPVIDVYVGAGGSIVWEQVKVPRNIRVIDNRAAAAPLGARGAVYDMATNQPIADADVALVRRSDRGKWEEFGRRKADRLGQFLFEEVPQGRYAVRARAAGYAPRSQAGYRSDKDYEFVVYLSSEASMRGTVTDPQGKPIPDVNVTAQNTLGIDGLGYSCSRSDTTNQDGMFEITSLPKGFAQLRCRGGSLHQATSSFELYEVPAKDIKIVMTGTGVVRIQVVGEDGKPPTKEVHVHIAQPGGNRVGTWGGSARCKPDGTFEFKGVPPGEYLVSTNRDLPISGDETGAVRVTIEAGKTAEVKVIHKQR